MLSWLRALGGFRRRRSGSRPDDAPGGGASASAAGGERASRTVRVLGPTSEPGPPAAPEAAELPPTVEDVRPSLAPAADASETPPLEPVAEPSPAADEPALADAAGDPVSPLDVPTVESALPDGDDPLAQTAPGEPPIPAPPPGRRRRSRRARVARQWAILAAIVVPLVLVGVGFWLSRGDSDAIPPSVSIDGVDVGGLSLAAAHSRLEQHLNELAVRRIELVTPKGRVPVSGEQLGLSARIDDAIEDAKGRRGAWSRLTARLGVAGEIDVPLALEVDEAKVDRVVKDIARRVDLRARNARLRINEDGVAVVPGKVGRAVDRDRLRELLATAPEPEQVEVPVVDRAPEIDDADAAEAKAAAERLLRPVNVTLRGKRARLDTGLLREALTIAPKAGELSLGLSRDVLAERLGPAFEAVTREPRDARFVLTENGIEIVEHRNGTEVDIGALVEALIARTGGAVEASLKPIAPSITTTAAESMQITELVSEFTTPYACCAPRVTNIRRAARIIDGMVIRPGGTFSLNEAIGQRTRKKGFVVAPMIEQGRLKDAVGGGVSQVATTVYNAAFFAGLDLVEHTPHQFYISRYPMGREATVSWRQPDLVIRNDWPAGILIDTETTDTSITVRFYSKKLGRKVTTTTGEPRNFRQATTIRIVDGSLAPGQTKVVQDGGIEGFDVTYTRKVLENGKVRRNERWSVRYIPEDTIIHVGPTPPPPPAKGKKKDA